VPSGSAALREEAPKIANPAHTKPCKRTPDSLPKGLAINPPDLPVVKQWLAQHLKGRGRGRQLQAVREKCPKTLHIRTNARAEEKLVGGKGGEHRTQTCAP
jgi:hypothetical protein